MGKIFEKKMFLGKKLEPYMVSQRQKYGSRHKYGSRRRRRRFRPPTLILMNFFFLNIKI